MGANRNTEPCKLSDVLGDFPKRIEPIRRRSESVGEVWEQLLPAPLREHCRIVAINGGCLKVATDSASYRYELQLCKAELLKELQRLCPGAAVRRVQFTMGGVYGE